jgi:hypothetical protein
MYYKIEVSVDKIDQHDRSFSLRIKFSTSPNIICEAAYHLWSSGPKRVQVNVRLPVNVHIYTSQSSLEEAVDLDGWVLA